MQEKTKTKFRNPFLMPKKAWKGMNKYFKWAKDIDYEETVNEQIKEGDYKEIVADIKELEAKEKELNAELSHIHKEKMILDIKLMRTPEMKKAYREAYSKIKDGKTDG